MERKETGILVWVLLLTACLVTGLPWVCFHRGYTNTGLSTPEVHDHVHNQKNIIDDFLLCNNTGGRDSGGES